MKKKVSKDRLEFIHRLYKILLSGFGFLMPFSLLLNINTVILVMLVLLSCAYAMHNKKKISFRQPFRLWSMILFFVVVLTSLFITQNLNRGLEIILRMLPIFLFGICMFFAGPISTVDIKEILKYFIYGCLLAWFFCFFSAVFFKETYPLALSEGFSYFTTPLDFHPSYFGMYFILAFCIYTNLFDFDTNTKKITMAICWILLLGLLIFLRSRGPLIAFVLISILLLTSLINNKGLIFVGVVTIILVLFNFEKFVALLSYGRELEIGLGERLQIWKNSFQIISNNPIYGVGIGDVQAELDLQYYFSGFDKGIDHRYNSHNQFLQTLVSSGLLGLIALLGIFLSLLRRARKFKLIYYFLIISLILMMVDSVLILQHGVYLFAFFASLFLKVDILDHEVK